MRRLVVLLVIGCGGSKPMTTATLDRCTAYADHGIGLVGPGGHSPPLIIELWRSVFVDICRDGQWSTATHDCYRAATSIAAFDACEAAQPEAERVRMVKLRREAQRYFPSDAYAVGTRDEVQQRFVLPLWGHPPAPGDTFATCDAYAEQLKGLRACASYHDPELEPRIEVLEREHNFFAEESPRVRGLWLGYCQAEAQRRVCH